MSMDAAAFKQEIMQLIITFMSSFDPSGRSTELWKQKLGSLSDKEFVKEVKAILDNPKRWFSPEIAPFDKKAQPTFNAYSKLAKMLGIELEEYVVLPYMNENTSVASPAVTLTKVPVGFLHLKRLQQMVRKKNKTALSIEQRDARNGQVRGDDKGSRITDADMYALAVFNAKPLMKEFYGPRADSMDAKEKLYDAIRKGERLPRLADLPNNLEDKVSLNTINSYILGATLITDLVSDSYMLPITKHELMKTANKMK